MEDRDTPNIACIVLGHIRLLTGTLDVPLMDLPAAVEAWKNKAVQVEQERCAQIAESPEAWNNLPIADDGEAIAVAIRTL